MKADPRNRLYHVHAQLCQQALSLMKDRNQKYARADDPFRNFRRHGRKGIVTRLDDKLARLDNHADNPQEFTDESLRDTILDVINYAILYYAYK